MTPEETLAKLQEYLKNVEKLKKTTLKVGIPEEASISAYKSGVKLIEVAAAHEYGTLVMPSRSFVRVPLEIHRAEIVADIDKVCKYVFEQGKDPIPGVKAIGVKAANIVKGAFDTNGYGTWEALDEKTVQIKIKAGKTTPMIWSGTLRKHVTWSIS